MKDYLKILLLGPGSGEFYALVGLALLALVLVIANVRP